MHRPIQRLISFKICNAVKQKGEIDGVEEQDVEVAG